MLGMNTYIHELVAWANQASVEFGKEIVAGCEMAYPDCMEHVVEESTSERCSFV